MESNLAESNPEAESESGLWVFGYGSLIWRPDMPYERAHPASATGWARRFWQGSHDHRGTISAPGRVLTLVPMPGIQCAGRVFYIPEAHVEQTLKELDYREKNGYVRQTIAVRGDEFSGELRALTYIAKENNQAWLGDAPIESIAAQIRNSHGPSGSNADYVLELHKSLQQDSINDEHISAVAAALGASG